MAARRGGRPRSFDRNAALDIAVRLFWAKGYEATSIRDLTSALGIAAPSLYNAFGDKRRLFAEAVTVYEREYGGFIATALIEEPTAHDAITRILTEAPQYYTRPGSPAGCLIVSGDAGTPDEEVRQVLRAVRDQQVGLVAERVRADLASGVIDARRLGDPTPDALARYTMAVVGGIAQQAREGRPRKELNDLAAIAVRLWSSIHREC